MQDWEVLRVGSSRGSGKCPVSNPALLEKLRHAASKNAQQLGEPFEVAAAEKRVQPRGLNHDLPKESSRISWAEPM